MSFSTVKYEYTSCLINSFFKTLKEGYKKGIHSIKLSKKQHEAILIHLSLKVDFVPETFYKELKAIFRRLEDRKFLLIDVENVSPELVNLRNLQKFMKSSSEKDFLFYYERIKTCILEVKEDFNNLFENYIFRNFYFGNLISSCYPTNTYDWIYGLLTHFITSLVLNYFVVQKTYTPFETKQRASTGVENNPFSNDGPEGNEAQVILVEPFENISRWVYPSFIIFNFEEILINRKALSKSDEAADHAYKTSFFFRFLCEESNTSLWKTILDLTYFLSYLQIRISVDLKSYFFLHYEMDSDKYVTQVLTLLSSRSIGKLTTFILASIIFSGVHYMVNASTISSFASYFFELHNEIKKIRSRYMESFKKRLIFVENIKAVYEIINYIINDMNTNQKCEQGLGKHLDKIEFREPCWNSENTLVEIRNDLEMEEFSAEKEELVRYHSVLSNKENFFYILEQRWNEGVLEINSSIYTVIKNYSKCCPELASSLQNYQTSFKNTLKLIGGNKRTIKMDYSLGSRFFYPSKIFFDTPENLKNTKLLESLKEKHIASPVQTGWPLIHYDDIIFKRNYLVNGDNIDMKDKLKEVDLEEPRYLVDFFNSSFAIKIHKQKKLIFLNGLELFLIKCFVKGAITFKYFETVKKGINELNEKIKKAVAYLDEKGLETEEGKKNVKEYFGSLNLNKIVHGFCFNENDKENIITTLENYKLAKENETKKEFLKEHVFNLLNIYLDFSEGVYFIFQSFDKAYEIYKKYLEINRWKTSKYTMVT